MQAVERVTKVLKALCQSQHGLGVKEASLTSGIPRSTVHRILNALTDAGLARQDPENKRYYPGAAILELSVQMLNGMEVRTAALPHLRELRDKLQETVFLSVFDGNRCVCVEKVDGALSLRYFVAVGRHMPTHASAASKAILAYEEESVRDRILAACDFARFTQYTLPDREALLADLETTRQRGYGLCLEEIEIGVNAVSVPIFGMWGAPIASISVVGPVARLNDEFFATAVPVMTEAASRISAAMGAAATAPVTPRRRRGQRCCSARPGGPKTGDT